MPFLSGGKPRKEKRSKKEMRLSPAPLRRDWGPILAERNFGSKHNLQGRDRPWTIRPRCHAPPIASAPDPQCSSIPCRHFYPPESWRKVTAARNQAAFAGVMLIFFCCGLWKGAFFRACHITLPRVFPIRTSLTVAFANRPGLLVAGFARYDTHFA